MLRSLGGLLALVLFLFAASGCASAPPPSEVTMPAPTPQLSALYNQSLNWTDCGAAQCSTVRVPKDWSEPAGASIELALTRRPADSSSDGVVILNLGGPGVAGADVLRSAPNGFGTAALRQRRDLVAFDPRGTGRSAPIECVTDRQLDDQLSGRQSDEHVAQTFVTGCQASQADWLGEVDTQSSIKDLDLIRAVLDQPKLNYLGYSYGTKLGAGYLQQFGSQAGRFVLDGPLPPSLTFEELQVGQSAGTHHALTRFIDACLAGSLGRCPFAGGRQNAFDQLSGLLQRAEALTAPRPLTPTLAATGVLAGLYRASDWPELAQRLAKAKQGDGAGLLEAADRYTGRGSDGRYDSNVMQAYWAISCDDFADRNLSRDQLTSAAAAVERAGPVLGRYLGGGQEICSAWPSEPDPVPVDPVRGLNPAPVIVAATDDPATPYDWAKVLQKQLTEAVIVTRRGDGHTSYGKGNECVDQRVDAYLLQGVSPSGGEC